MDDFSNSTIHYIHFFSFNFVLLGYLNSIIQLTIDLVVRKVFPQTSNYQPITVPSATAVKTQANWQPQQPNNLISNANQMAEANFDFTVKQ